MYESKYIDDIWKVYIFKNKCWLDNQLNILNIYCYSKII